MKLTKYKQEITSITRMEDCIGSDIPSLALVRKEKGEEETLKMIGHYIKEVNGFFNVQRKMTNKQIFMTAKLILKKYPHFNLADISIIFENMLTPENKDEKLFGKIDGGEFLIKFEEWDKDREVMAEEMSGDYHNTTKNEVIVENKYTKTIIKNGKEITKEETSVERIEYEPKKLDGVKFIEETYGKQENDSKK